MCFSWLPWWPGQLTTCAQKKTAGVSPYICKYYRLIQEQLSNKLSCITYMIGWWRICSSNTKLKFSCRSFKNENVEMKIYIFYQLISLRKLFSNLPATHLTMNIHGSSYQSHSRCSMSRVSRGTQQFDKTPANSLRLTLTNNWANTIDLWRQCNTDESYRKS